MLRLGLVLYLMLGAGGGPWFCCCMPSEVANLFSSAAKKEEERSPCCGQHGKKKGETPSEPCRSPASCPCHETDSVYVKESGRNGEQNVRSMILLAVVLQPIVGLSSLHMPDNVEKESITSPVRSSQDILRALHILRC